MAAPWPAWNGSPTSVTGARSAGTCSPNAPPARCGSPSIPPSSALAADTSCDAAAWSADADLLATLTLGLALEAADAQLNPRAPAPAPGTPPRRYTIVVGGRDPVVLGLSFPTLVVDRGDRRGRLQLSGTLNLAELEQLLRRLRILGHEVLGVFKDDPR